MFAKYTFEYFNKRIFEHDFQHKLLMTGYNLNGRYIGTF